VVFCLKKLGFRRAFADRQHLRDFLVAVAIYAIKVQDKAIPFGHAVQELHDLPGFQALKERSRPIVALQKLLPGNVHIKAEFQAAPVAVDGRILNDAFQPAFKRTVALVVPDAVEDLDERILEDVLGFGRAVAVPQGNAIQYPIVGFIQLLETCGFTGFTASYQFNGISHVAKGAQR